MKLPDFSQVNLLVAGESGIDEYLMGDTRRISPEAPVPVIEIESQTQKIGLAGNVAQNITSLGAKSSVITVCGVDENRARLESLLHQNGVQTFIITDETRPTLRKVRVIAQKQHLLRIDHEKTHPLDPKVAKEFREKICDELVRHDGIVLQDYCKGLWTSDTASFIQHAKAHKKPVFVDPNSNTPIQRYFECTLLTPNIREAESLCGLEHLSTKNAAQNQSRLENMAKNLLEKTQCEHAIITCGQGGMISISRRQNTLKHIPTFAREVFDVTGAGDTVIAVLSMMYVMGHSLQDCIRVANAAAGIVVGKMGAATVSLTELQDELERVENFSY